MTPSLASGGLLAAALSTLSACSGGTGTETASGTAAASATGTHTSTGTSSGTVRSSSSAAATSAAASSSSTGTSNGGTSTGSISTSGTTGAGPATYVYIENNDPSTSNTNAVLAYQRIGQTLVPLSGVSSFALGGQGVGDPNFALGPIDADQEVMIDHAHQRLYAINEASSTIGAFDINGDGSLSAVPGSPFLSGGYNPVSLEPVGDLMYVTNQAYDDKKRLAPNYTALRINSDGSLSPIAGLKPMATSVGSSPSQVLVSPDRMTLFGIDVFGPISAPPINPIRSFALDGDGHIFRAPGDPYAVPPSLTAGLPVDAPFAFGLAVHPTQNILYIGFDLSAVVGAFSYDSTGALTYIGGTPLTGSLVCWLRVNSEGTRMYAVNSGDASISVVDLSSPRYPVETQHHLLKDSEGTPFVGQGVPQFVTSAPYQETLSPDEKSLFVVSQRVTVDLSDTTSPGNILHTLAIADDGTVSEPGADIDIDTPLDSRPQGVASIQLP